MKFFGPVSRCLVVAGLIFVSASGSRAQGPAGEEFPGIKKALTPQQYAAAGLGKLSPEEQARLDEALKGYFTGASQRVAEQAASQAVDRAVKEKRVQAPTLIDSRIVGTISGWGERTVFVLENGERWKPIDGTKRTFAPVENPTAFIVRDTFGYKMAIGGAAVVRVKRL